MIELKPETPIWNPVFPDKYQFNIDILLQRSKLLEDQMNNQYPNKRSGFSMSVNDSDYKINIITGLSRNCTNNLLIALSAMDELNIFTSLSSYLGLGEGLTPSGDDFICGFLLAIHFWQGSLSPDLDLHSISQKIEASAWEKTNTLSANLIKCATLGSSDERIINCLQWLNGKESSLPVVLEGLFSYGNSSGADVLAGILTFIQSSSAYSFKFQGLP